MNRIDLASCAPQFASTALANIILEYPNRLDQTLQSDDDLHPPRALHPVFYGSYDWHSSVHMHWLLARLLRLFPSLPNSGRIGEVFDAHFTPTKVSTEISFLQQPANRTFERTYGWAWLLKLQAEMAQLAAANSGSAVWYDALQPLANLLAERYMEFLPLAQFPIRAGTHANSAFALLFALDYADSRQDISLRRVIEAKANAWFATDRRYPAAYEPSGDDFLSGGLIEAVLMMRVLGSANYAEWWNAFCPASDLQTWLLPVQVADRTDPKLAHLDGLNLSRAWCWKLLIGMLPASLHKTVIAAINAHIAASLPHATMGDYAGTHWLASFALLALTEGNITV